jgi:hypothetical protein
MTTLDDLRAAGIECWELREYQPFRNRHAITTAIAGHAVVRQDKADAAIDAIARIAIRLSGELAAAKAHWDAAASIAREREAERDRLRSCLEETEVAKTDMREELNRARDLAVGLEVEIAQVLED